MSSSTIRNPTKKAKQQDPTHIALKVEKVCLHQSQVTPATVRGRVLGRVTPQARGTRIGHVGRPSGIGQVFLSILEKQPTLKRRYEPGERDIDRWFEQIGDADCSEEERIYSMQMLSNVLRDMVEDVNKEGNSTDLEQDKLCDQGALEARMTFKIGSKPLFPTIQECYNSMEVANVLSCSRFQVQKLFENKKLLGFQPNGRNRYFPKFQFENGYILPGLDIVLSILNENQAQAVSFLLMPFEELNGGSVLESLKTNQIEMAVKATQQYVKEMEAMRSV